MLTQDPTVNNILQKFISRSDAGMKTYGNSLRDNNTKTFVQWIEDTQEELLDTIVYLEKVKEKAVQFGIGDMK
jgi:hypothetical protein